VEKENDEFSNAQLKMQVKIAKESFEEAFKAKKEETIKKIEED
jgi:hypothetical protein